MIAIDSLDHLVLTVRDLDATLAFYCNVLGMTAETFAPGRTAVHFGKQKINLHVVGKEFEPKADRATAGSGDLCFLTSVPLDTVIEALRSNGITILLGPVPKTGAQGPIRSVYVRDPDLNLIEISNLII
jgi:catechol 2,3-dioxygenase-like lactoylglutathione lyase family enzyme